MAVKVVDDGQSIVAAIPLATSTSYFSTLRRSAKTNDTRHRDITSGMHRYIYTSTDENVAESVDVILMVRWSDTRVARAPRVFIVGGGWEQ